MCMYVYIQIMLHVYHNVYFVTNFNWSQLQWIIYFLCAKNTRYKEKLESENMIKSLYIIACILSSIFSNYVLDNMFNVILWTWENNMHINVCVCVQTKRVVY